MPLGGKESMEIFQGIESMELFQLQFNIGYWSVRTYNNINFFFNLSRLKAALKSFDVYNLRIAKYFFFDRCFSDIPLFCEISTSNIKNDKYMDLLCKFQILVNSLKMALLRDIVNYFLKAKKTETLPRLKICFCQYCDCNKMSNCHCWHEQLGDFCCWFKRYLCGVFIRFHFWKTW